MSTNTLASQDINSISFGLPTQGPVPQEEEIFVLSSSQLEEIIEKAALNATADLESRMAELEARLEAHSRKIYQKDEPGPTDQERGERLDRYMDARRDHKAPFESLKGFLEISDVLLNHALKALQETYPNKYIVVRDQQDKRKRWLMEIPKIS